MNYPLPKNSSDFKTTHGKSLDRSDPEASCQVRRQRKYSDFDDKDSESLEQ